jgi:glycosyltransferase involved in cell wall biosynthesis
MKILMVHNTYQVRGGEDSVEENEVELLRSNGHDVTELKVNNEIINGFFSKLWVALSVIFSISGYKIISRAIEKEKPDVVHVHNYFPVLSPSIFYACKKKAVPVVHTLHNFRAICPTALLQHKGRIVERSIADGPWWAVKERVYRGSLVGTFFLALMIAFHRKAGTWRRQVDAYIALTEFNKQKYVEAGWPEDKIFVKPNFTRHMSDSLKHRKPYALFVGRLSEEKGVPFLLDAFKDSADLELRIIGEGPLESLVREAANTNIHYLGKQPKETVFEHMESAACLTMTSNWYEGFPMVIVEAMSCGLPVVVPAMGNMEIIVPNGKAGMHYQPEDKTSFISSVRRLLMDDQFRDDLSAGARMEYNQKYTAEVNLVMLEAVYDFARSGANH